MVLRAEERFLGYDLADDGTTEPSLSARHARLGGGALPRVRPPELVA